LPDVKATFIRVGEFDRLLNLKMIGRFVAHHFNFDIIYADQKSSVSTNNAAFFAATATVVFFCLCFAKCLRRRSMAQS